MKIGGFNFSKKQLIIFGVIILVIVLLIVSNNYKQNKEAEERAAIAQSEVEAALAASSEVSVEEYSIHDEIQKSLIDEYGEPPEGFEWDYTGNLVALGDETSNCEDVIYMFVRALSILDFSTAEKYSLDSNVVSKYSNYYDGISNSITDYYDNFLRKQFKESLTSLEVNAIGEKAVFADGTQYVTLTVSVLDLSDKDFWTADKDKIFEQLRVYRETEEDSVKLNQYVYDYILDAYTQGKIAKKSYTVDLVVSKENGGGWLVTGDKELCAILEYENGVDVAEYILDGFEDWYMDVTLQEQLDAINNSNNNME